VAKYKSTPSDSQAPKLRTLRKLRHPWRAPWSLRRMQDVDWNRVLLLHREVRRDEL